MGLIFWRQHEYTMTDMYAGDRATYREMRLHDFLKMIRSEHQVVVNNILSRMIQSKPAGELLRHIKTCFQDEVRDNDFLKQMLKYFRKWLILHRLSPSIRDRS